MEKCDGELSLDIILFLLSSKQDILIFSVNRCQLIFSGISWDNINRDFSPENSRK